MLPMVVAQIFFKCRLAADNWHIFDPDFAEPFDVGRFDFLRVGPLSKVAVFVTTDCLR